MKGKDRGQLCEGMYCKAWKNISLHTLLWYVPEKSKKKNLDINVLESFKSLN